MITAKDVERHCELGRQIKALAAERQALGATLLLEMDTEGMERWEDEFLGATIVEKQGSEVADVAALREAGLHQYIKRGNPSRYVLTRWKS